MTTVEVTGHRQREAWAQKVLPPVEEVRPGLWSIPVVMPANPLRYILVYALALPDGLALIDTGWNTDDAWQMLLDGIRATGHDVSDVRHVSITHLHPDHFGLVPRLLEHADPILAMHRNDARHLRFHDEAAIENELRAAAAELALHGAPTDNAELGLREFVRLPKDRHFDVELGDDEPLDLPGWNLRTIWTPGHTAGHLCFIDSDAGVVFTGDHLLPRISPNVSVNPFQSDDPLDEYLISLAHTEHLPDVEALPSHEYRFRGVANRAGALLTHHQDRLDEIEAAVRAEPEATAWDITRSVTWSRPFSDLSVMLSRMALHETHAHLIVLERRGIIRSDSGTGSDGGTPVRWSVLDTATESATTQEGRS